MDPVETQAGRRPARRRGVLVGLVVVLIAIAWIVKLLVVDLLADGRIVDLGLLQLRLGYNSGVAFSIGAGLPDGVVLAITAVVTVVLAGYAWVSAPTMSWVGVAGLAGILAGAITNLLSRFVDGAVADYFHTGWFATFNLPDSMITVGVVLVIASALFPRAQQAPPHPTAEA
ncbi:signal peptidase II [Pseudonocardia sp. GCM10023141]|uniref:signal peptidase II n=1 Tax=Pseudonocardia sp. GCM10023141 TaxID=3252653 RepID=UPI00360ED9DE